MAKIVVFCGNPRRDSFGGALSEAYAKGARGGGHEARVFHLADLDFDPTATRGFGAQELEPDLEAAKEAILWSEHLVFVWPLWMGMPPALLKGFLERILVQPGVALEFLDRIPYYRPLLRGRSARQIVTMQAPALLYRFLAGARGVKTMERDVLGFVGVKPVRRTLFGMMSEVSAEKRAQRLAEVEALGRRAR